MSCQVPVSFHRCIHTPPPCPGDILLHHFPPDKAADFNHEAQRYNIHGQASSLEEPAGVRGCHHRIHDQSSSPNSKHHEEGNKEEIHNVSQESVVTAHFPQEPAGLEQRVGDLAHKHNGIDFSSRLPEPQHHDHAADAQRVVEQHEVPLCLEIQTPAQVKDKVTQGQGQHMDLKSCVW